MKNNKLLELTYSILNLCFAIFTLIAVVWFTAQMIKDMF